jgi:uncharacterized protein YqeY
MSHATHWRAKLRDALTAARKDRDAIRVAALRSALSAIDNAETPEGTQLEAQSSGTIANAVVGLGSAEVARRDLSDDEIRDLMRAEVEERMTAAAVIETTHTERADNLRAEAAVLTGLLGDV